ncbi:MAG: hypothetical protein ABSH09_24850 [Bryobacteraceae bacterium]|jgi:hypothetical protein
MSYDAVTHRSYAVLGLALVVWIGLAAWLVYLFESQRDYELNYFARLDKLHLLPVYHPGDVVLYSDSRKLLWIGWAGPEAGYRWSADKAQTGFLFRTNGTDNWNCPCKLKFDVRYTFGKQHVTLRIRGKTITTAVIGNEGTLAFEIPPGIIQPNATVSVQLLLPDAAPPGVNGDNRVLGIAITDLEIDSSG